MRIFFSITNPIIVQIQGGLEVWKPGSNNSSKDFPLHLGKWTSKISKLPQIRWIFDNLLNKKDIPPSSISDVLISPLKKKINNYN